ncbi:hypothetical protein B0H13DRAFT_1910708 [Mycena leptocephala]|nr:hypothetical protein B0H13DRAFT_1910708 [Mycena leptocephala]
MSDPAVPPFTQSAPKPDIHFDNNGLPWLRDTNGQWAPAPLPPSLQPPFELRGTAAATIQPTAYNFPSTFTADFSAPPHAPSSTRVIPPHRTNPIQDDPGYPEPSKIFPVHLGRPKSIATGSEVRKTLKHSHIRDSEEYTPGYSGGRGIATRGWADHSHIGLYHRPGWQMGRSAPLSSACSSSRKIIHGLKLEEQAASARRRIKPEPSTITIFGMYPAF